MSSDVQEDHHETLGERLSHMLSPSAMFAKAGTAMGEAYAAEADALQEPLMRPHGPHDGADLEEPLLDTGGYQSPLRPCGEGHGSANCHWLQTTATLLTLQLGWGLWLIPSDFAHLGWLPGGVCLVALASLTVYSGFMFTRLYQSVNGAVLFGDIGEAAAGKAGRQVVYAIIYSLDATRCVILHLAATQSLRHIFPEEGGPLGGRPPLWQCGLAVLFGALLLAQIRSLSRLSWFFLVGTGSQAIAIGIVVLELIRHPNPEAKTQTSIPLTLTSLMPAAVALMNMIFAYGGQFAFIEVMTSMKKPALFARSVSLCTTIMTIMYASLGVVGYWSRGDAIGGIIIFSLPPGVLSSTAAAFILLQATAQYLVNLNVWSHNLLTLVARKWDWNVKITCTSDHARLPWLLTTTFVLLYSFAIAVTVPYFSPLVGIVTSITYLTCAYTIPSWFTLKLVRRLSEPEKWLLYFLIPASVGLSIFGFYASFVSLLNNASGGEGSFGSSA